jgi:predicted O-methyltransferase YrrM
MNGVLEEILSSGFTKTATGNESLAVHSSISLPEGQFIHKLVGQLNPTVTLEVGLAYGISGLFIRDALKVRSGTQHIAIDPNQHGGEWGSDWAGIGMANLRRAGYGDIVKLIEEPSFRALPALERAGQKIDFAFIDGWHTFDFTLVDFFYIDRMLNIGGVVAFDDANWPGVRKVCRFVRTNLAYSIHNVERSSDQPKRSLRRQLSELRHGKLHNIVKDFSLGLKGSCIAFRKEAHDTRPWNHFTEF